MNQRAKVFFSFHLLFWFIFFELNQVHFIINSQVYKNTPIGTVLLVIWSEGER